MRINKKPAAIAAVTAACALALAGCASASGAGAGSAAPAEAVETVTFSTGTQFPPMHFVEADELTGFDVDLGTAIAERAGLKAEFNKSQFSQFLSDVSSGRTDGILGAMLDKVERQEEAAFIDYLETGYQFFTLKDIAAEHGISELTDFCGLTVAASTTATYAEAIEAWSAENCNGDDIEIFGANDSPDALLQMRQGRAQAVVQTKETIAYLASNDPDVQMIGEPITSSFYGLGIAKENTDLLERLSTALEEMVADGSYAEIAEKWNLDTQAVDRVTINLEGR
jgi:polar amino acid transport system substrate-binding protein